MVDVWPGVDGGVDVGEDVGKRFDLFVGRPCGNVGGDGSGEIAGGNCGQEFRH